MQSEILEKIDKAGKRDKPLAPFAVGDTVKVSVRIREGDKERVQSFSGIVIGRRGRGATETFTVRRISFGVGVERVFPLHSPNIVNLEVLKSAKVRRAKLYYMRGRAGKNARLKNVSSTKVS